MAAGAGRSALTFGRDSDERKIRLKLKQMFVGYKATVAQVERLLARDYKDGTYGSLIDSVLSTRCVNFLNDRTNHIDPDPCPYKADSEDKLNKFSNAQWVGIDLINAIQTKINEVIIGDRGVEEASRIFKVDQAYLKRLVSNVIEGYFEHDDEFETHVKAVNPGWNKEDEVAPYNSVGF